ncbi:hypothetical protein M0R72_17435 [Candidatus Pacearchaeota archaeon]|jgi:hypothetical protein|nr:hypothetical protein [Candidatus Pacearchaeota archaeon]
MHELFHNQFFIAFLVLVLSAAVRALPEPQMFPIAKRSMFYLWLYNFTHAVLANWDKLGGKK